jgi:predicted ATPase
MVLATCRVQQGSADQPLKRLKQDLLLHRLAVELELEPLDRHAVGELLKRELKQNTLPPELVAFMYKRSEGNPLFVIAMLEHLIAQRYLVREGIDPAWKQGAPFPEMDPDLPDELSQMIELEIERLSPGDQRLLEAGSLIDVAFPAWAVAAALEEDAAETEETCDDLARRLHFVRRAGQDELPDGSRSAFYVFAHGLYREVLYQRQSASRRARRHTRIAERLGGLFAGREANVAPEMAMHYEAAGNWQRAASVLRSAAWHAQQRRAHAEAAALLEQALRAAENLGDVEGGVAAREIRSDLVAARQSMLASSPRP